MNAQGAQAIAKAKFGDDKDKLALADNIFKKCEEEGNKIYLHRVIDGKKSLSNCLQFVFFF